MNKEEFAKLLNGREYREEMTTISANLACKYPSSYECKSREVEKVTAGKVPALKIMAKSKIEWTEQTWNPIVESSLLKPLKRKKPTKYFVNSMSDLFHENVRDECIDKVFAVMALCPQHIFQILTKRPERMREYFTRCEKLQDFCTLRIMSRIYEVLTLIKNGNKHLERLIGDGYFIEQQSDVLWFKEMPLPNVWLGVSAEDQTTFEDRIFSLLETPAAIRWVSAEPLLGNLNFDIASDESSAVFNALTGEFSGNDGGNGVSLDWVIVGGESGMGARPCNIEWMRSIVKQCKDADVPVFIKQLGRNVHVRNDNGFLGDDATEFPEGTRVEDYERNPSKRHQGALIKVLLKNKKGGDVSEFPEDLRIREYPQ